MLAPVIQEFRSSKSPWEVFQSAYASSPICFFLDSIDYRPPDQTFSYIGLDPFLELQLQEDKLQLTGDEEARYSAAKLFFVLRRLLKKCSMSSRRSDFFTGGAVGYWGYELVGLFERVPFRKKPGPAFPQLYLGFFRDLIVYDHKKKKYLLVTHYVSGKNPSRAQGQREARSRIERLKKFFRDSPAAETFQLKKFRPEISKQKFESMVKHAKQYIAAGDIYQANLSQRFSFKFHGSALTLYGALRTINPSPFAAFFKIGDLQIIGSSPERLIRKRGRICETRPIAGTRPRKSAHQSERELERELHRNEKERAEHLMLVDLERNDLGRVCKYRSVRVAEFMKIEKYSHVIHLVSKIIGRLANGKDALDLIQAVFPGGTITGCPKIRCMEIIDELEPVRRGIYTGSIGYLDFQGDLDLNIVIRTLILKKNKGYLQVGAGIVHDSNPEREYQETLHKGEALVEALVGASL